MTLDNTAANALDPAALFRAPPILGFEFVSPNAEPVAGPMPQESRLHELRVESTGLDGQQGQISAMRRQLASPRADGRLFWGAILIGIASALAPGDGVLFGSVFLVCVCVVAFSLPYLSLRSERRVVSAYDRRRRRVEAELHQLESRVAGDRAERARTEARRMAELSVWRRLTAPSGRQRLEVLGGTKVGWEAFVLTCGASLLGSSARLLVLDLTERHVATHLVRLAVETGRNVRHVALPEQADALDLYTGLSTREFVECIVAAWHDAESDAQARADLARDSFVVEQICGCLEDNSVTVPRLSAAVNTLLRVEVPDPRLGTSLSDREQECLECLFGAQLRGSAQFMDRLLAFAGFLRQLAAGAPVGPPLVRLAHLDADLTVLEATAQGHLLDKRALASVIVQVLQKQHSRASSDNRALPTHIFLVGADSVGRSALERLARFAGDAGVQVAVFFESLRSPGAEMMGSGEAVQLFMRLGHRKEAEQAAEHLGKQYKFVLSQLSTMEADSVNETFGEQLTRSSGHTIGLMSLNVGRVPLLFPSVSVSRGSQTGTSWGKQTGKSRQETQAENRVHELVVEPEVLQTLGQYTFVFRSAPDQVSAGDCDPEIAYSSRMSAQGLPRS